MDFRRRSWLKLIAQKLNLKPGQSLALVNPPQGMGAILAALLLVSDPYTDRLTHFTAFEVNGPQQPPVGMELRVLPRRSYAIFRPEHFLDPYAYSLLVRYAFGEWFPMSGRQFSGEFTMDVYFADRMELFVPLA